MTTEQIAWIVTVWYAVSFIAMYTSYDKPDDAKFGWVKSAIQGLLWPLYVLAFVIGAACGIFLIPHYLVHRIIENNEQIKQLESEIAGGDKQE